VVEKSCRWAERRNGNAKKVTQQRKEGVGTHAED
jgi:hypothetical protein